jgi:hypothetical protein
MSLSMTDEQHSPCHRAAVKPRNYGRLDRERRAAASDIENRVSARGRGWRAMAPNRRPPIRNVGHASQTKQEGGGACHAPKDSARDPLTPLLDWSERDEDRQHAQSDDGGVEVKAPGRHHQLMPRRAAREARRHTERPPQMGRSEEHSPRGGRVVDPSPRAHSALGAVAEDQMIERECVGLALRKQKRTGRRRED